VVQHPIVCNVRSGSLDPFSKSFQDIFVEGVINCLSWRYKFFAHNAKVVEITIIIVFTLDLLMSAFFGRGELSCVIPHFAVWSRDRSPTPIIHLLLLLYQKKSLNFSSSKQILTNFQPVLFLLHRQVFKH